MLSFITQREMGIHKPQVLRDAETTRMLYSIELSSSKNFKTGHKGAILAMDIDITEQRYLLSGAGDGTLNIFDLEKVLQPVLHTFTPVVSLNQPTNPTNNLGSSVSSLQWYPHDTGIFATSSFSGYTYIWDANEEEVVRTFDIEAKAYSISMSPCATQHSLIAVGSDDTRITLCDMKTGHAIWKLHGHLGRVLAVRWCPGIEFLLASGGGDGTIRLWDIRKPGGCLTQFDRFLHSKDKAQNDEKKRESLSPKGKKQKYTYLENAKRKIEAHHGAVTCIAFTPDSRHILSTGSDKKMRLWNVQEGTNELVNYDKVLNNAKGSHSIAISPNSELVYLPSGTDVQVYKIQTGEHITTLSNHFDNANACVFAPYGHVPRISANLTFQELYSGGSDSMINIWEPHRETEATEEAKMNADVPLRGGEEDGDRWSISEEEGW